MCNCGGGLGPTDGPTLDMPTASKLIYELQQQMIALDPWTTSVQVAITDHAKLIDHARDKSQGSNIQSNISFERLTKYECLKFVEYGLIANSDFGVV